MNKNELLSDIYRHIGESLNISDSEREKITASYKAVGKHLSNLEGEFDVHIYPQGSLALGTVIRPLKDDQDGEYDVDMVCLIKRGNDLESKKIKTIVGNKLKDNEKYKNMLDKEGKRCWTLQYADFHMDILPSVPKNYDQSDTRIRLTHTDDYIEYEDEYSNPKGYLEWFQKEMKESFIRAREDFSMKNEVEIDEVPLYNLRTPLQISIQLLKRHRDIMYQNSKNKDHKPISIIITTLAAKAYRDKEADLYTTLTNIINNMGNYIEVNENNEYIVENPTDSGENFADRWKEEPIKRKVFFEWLEAAKKDIISNPLLIDTGLDNLQSNFSNVFGEKIAERSFVSFGDEKLNKRKEVSLGVSKEGVIVEDEDLMVSKIPDHTFYGRE